MASSSPEINPSVDSAETQPRFSYKDASHEEVLEDLSSRFILNLPDEELASLERICFQVEQAHWFYEDFIREQNPIFPSLPLKKFSAMLFHACPLLHQWSNDHENAFNMFMQYKTRVPVCGAIMLNDTWDKCVLVKGWKSSSGWGFPKGKINEDEPKHICAIREVLEETGYNLAGKLKPEDVIELSIKEQRISLFVVPGVEEDFPFQTKTRKEISRIEWFRLFDLPTWKRNKQVPGKFYLISPFIGPLKAFINEYKPRPPRKSARQKRNQKIQSQSINYASDVVATDFDTDVIQESDSQTSDNQIEQHASTSQSRASVLSPTAGMLKSDHFDPHVARLLNSLSLSASGSVPESTYSVNLPSTDSTTPISISPSCNFDVEPRPDLSHQSHQKSRSQKNNPLTTSLHGPGRDSSTTPLATSRPQSFSPCSPSMITRGVLRSSAQIRDYTAPAPTSPSNRRPIRTDISPYLTKATVDNTSARRLQQLALLERVADESARMLPQARVTTNPHSPPLPTVYRGSPIPEPLGPGQQASPSIYYSTSSPQPMPSVLHTFPPFNSGGGPMDRARTSQTFHRGVGQPSSYLSMNQTQLLNLMNNAPPVAAPHSIQPPLPHFLPQPPHSYAHIYDRPMSSSTGPTNPLTYPPTFWSYGAPILGPNRYSSATPEIDAFTSRPVPPGGTAQTLLSILNGNRPLQSNPVVAPPMNRPT